MASSVLTFTLLGNDLGAARAIARVGAAADLTNAKIAKSANASEAAAARMGKAFNAVGKVSTVIAIGIGVEGVKAAVNFESALTRVSTQAGVAHSQLKPLGDALLKLSPKVGFNPDDLATSLYHVESAFASTGISAQNAIDIVSQASKLAKIGKADLEDTTQAVIGVVASGIKGIRNAQDAAAQLNQLVGSGDTTLQAVDKAIATGILPTSQALGLSFKDVSAAIATLTDNATPADEAATRLRTTFSLIEKPSKQAVGALESIGLNTTSLAEDMRKPDGLLLALTDLKTHLDATYPPSRSAKLSISEIQASTKGYVTSLEAQGVQQKVAIDLGKKYEDSLKRGGTAATQQAQTILTAFGGAKSGSTFLTLYEELSRLQSKYHEFGTSAQAAAKFQGAWAQQQTTAKQKLDDLKASWDVFEVKLGNAILPDLKKVLDVLAAHPGILKAAAVGVGLFAAAWTAVKIGSIISSLGRMATAILGVGTASATAAAESSAANLGTGALGARAATGAFAAGGAARAGSSARFAGLEGLTKLIVPVGLVLVGADLVKSLDKAVRDIQNGHAVDGITKILGTKFAQGLTFGISKGISDALKSGDWTKALGPGAGLIQKLLGGGLPGGPLSGKLAPDFGKATAQATKFWASLDDKGKIADFQSSLKSINTLVVQNSGSLVGNSYAASTNRAGITALVRQAEAAAAAYARTTGNQDDYTKSLQLALPAIENAAAANGLNKQQVDNLINALIHVPPETPAHVALTGTKEALIDVANLEDSLRALAQPIIIPILAQAGLTGVASPNYVPGIGQIATAQGGLNFGASGPGGVAGGIGHAAGGIAHGWAIVGERGPELMHVGSPSAVIPNFQTMAALRGGGGGTEVHLHLPNVTNPQEFRRYLSSGGDRDIDEALSRRRGRGGVSYAR